jgi:hypothetical protein
MVLTALFEGEENRRTILVWVAMPVVLTFVSWLSVQTGHAALRVVVWLSVVFIAFFVWIAAFSIGPYYLPVVILLMLAGFAPWSKQTPDDISGAEQIAAAGAGAAGPEILGDILKENR